MQTFRRPWLSLHSVIVENVALGSAMTRRLHIGMVFSSPYFQLDILMMIEAYILLAAEVSDKSRRIDATTQTQAPYYSYINSVNHIPKHAYPLPLL
jgi:hypothetical protein